MAVGDFVEMTQHWPESAVAAMDVALSEESLPALSVVRARFSKAIQRVVRRGIIKDDTEFFALRNAADMLGEDASILWPLIESYEVGKAS